MGIVIKSGNISLTPGYVQSKSGERIRFNLTPGELLYDQNGFCYQNQAYTPEGIPARFGTKLGTFDDVLVRNIVLDLYNNIADLEIEADLFVPLLKRRINVKMLRDDDGFFVCNVCETEKFTLDEEGKVKLSIIGGHLDDLGMHLDATIDLVLGENGEEINLQDAMFNDSIIPSHDFPMEIRRLEVSSVASGSDGDFAKMGRAFIGYYHSLEKFKFSRSLTDFGMYGANINGDIGFEMCPDFWELRVGHPEMFAAGIGPLYGGFGMVIRKSDIDESFIMAKLNVGFSASAGIDIVCVSGFLEAGGEGYLGDSGLSLLVYVRGGIRGSVLGHDVINLMLEAQGNVTRGASGPWNLGASARIRYHVDLLIDIKGSVDWHISKTF